MRAAERILADNIYNRIISEGYYRPPYTSSYYRPYYGPYRPYPLTTGLSYDVNRLLNYNEYINRYETVNRVVGYSLDPTYEEILRVLYDL